MSWFLIALSAPILWAATNHLDKYLLSKYVRGSVGSLIIFSCLFAVLALPVIGFLQPSTLIVEPSDIGILLGVGVLNTLGVLCYLYALSEDETSIVVPLFQLIPVFAFVFGYFILGEAISNKEAIGGALVITGSILLGIDFKTHFRVKGKMLLCMLGSGICFGLHGALFKMVAIEENFWLASFWEYAGLLLTGIIFLLAIKSYRHQFFDLIRCNPGKIFGFNILNESLVLLGNIATAYALTLAPVALVLTVSGFQPLFVLVFGFFLTIFFPNIEREDISVYALSYKMLSIVIMATGGYLMN